MATTFIPTNYAGTIKPPRFNIAEPMGAAQTLTKGYQDIEANALNNQLTQLRLKETPNIYARQAEAAATANQLAQIRLGEAQIGFTETQGEQEAMTEYRKRLAAGDKNAITALDAYPGLKLKVHTDTEGAEPDLVKDAAKRVFTLSEVYKDVFTWPPGSAEEKEAWDAAADVSLENGYITEATATRLKNSPPNKELLTRILRAGEELRGATVRPKTIAEVDPKVVLERQKQAWEMTKGDQYDTRTPKEKIDDYNAALKILFQPDGIDPTPILLVPPKEDKANVAGEENPPETPLTPTEDTTATATAIPEAETAPAMAWKPGDPLPASHRNAATYTGPKGDAKAQRAWFDAIPPGAPFINPLTGAPKYKKLPVVTP